MKKERQKIGRRRPDRVEEKSDRTKNK